MKLSAGHVPYVCDRGTRLWVDRQRIMEEMKAIYAALDPDPSKYVSSPRDGEEFIVVWGLDLEQDFGRHGGRI